MTEVTTAPEVMTPDIAKLREAHAYAVRYPDSHYQGTWVGVRDVDDIDSAFDVRAGNGEHPPCGTTLCMAGWGAFLNAPKGAKLLAGPASVIFPDGQQRKISEFAGDEFGITIGQGYALFFAASDADELDAMIDALEASPMATHADLCRAAGCYQDTSYNRYYGEYELEPFSNYYSIS